MIIRRETGDRDDGFTLIELVVAAALTLIVLSIVAGMMISSMNTANTVRSVTGATMDGQLVTNSIDRGIRNSQGLAIGSPAVQTPFSLTVPSGSDQLLIARVTGSGAASTSNCAAWYFSATAKTVRYKTFGSALTVANKPISEPASWTLLSSGVKPISGTTIFSQNGQRLAIAFKVEAGSHPAVIFRTSSGSQTGMTGSAACS